MNDGTRVARELLRAGADLQRETGPPRRRAAQTLWPIQVWPVKVSKAMTVTTPRQTHGATVDPLRVVLTATKIAPIQTAAIARFNDAYAAARR